MQLTVNPTPPALHSICPLLHTSSTATACYVPSAKPHNVPHVCQLQHQLQLAVAAVPAVLYDTDRVTSSGYQEVHSVLTSEKTKVLPLRQVHVVVDRQGCVAEGLREIRRLAKIATVQSPSWACHGFQYWSRFGPS